MKLITTILLFAISSYCMNLTYSASAGDDGSGSWTPRRGGPKKLLSSGKKKEARQLSDKERKRGRVEGSSSSQRTTGKGKEVQYLQEQPGLTQETRGQSRVKYTLDQLLTVLRLMFTTKENDGRDDKTTDWNTVYPLFTRIFGNVTDHDRLQARGNALLRDILGDFRHRHENIDWDDSLNRLVLKIYYQTEDSEEGTHDARMRAVWQSVGNLPKVRPGYLFWRAERMIESVRPGEVLLQSHSGATMPIQRRVDISWNDAQNEHLLHSWLTYNRKTDGNKRNYIYDKAIAFDHNLGHLTHGRIYDRAKYLGENWEREHNIVGRRTSRRHRGREESSTRNPELSHGHPDLTLRLGLSEVHHHSDQKAHDSDDD